MNEDVASFFVEQIYRGLLGRNPDIIGLNHWKNLLCETGDIEMIFQSFLDSDENKKVSPIFSSKLSDKFIALLLEDLGDGMNILDIGSIKLDYEPYIWNKLGQYLNLNVIGFDPQLESGVEIIEPVNEFKKVEILTYGIALGDGLPQTIYINNDQATSSMYQIIDDLPYNHLSTIKTQRLETISTKKLDEMVTHENIDLLKIDVQGYELDILTHGVKTLEKSGIVLIEVGYSAIYKNQPLFSDVDLFMRKNGFELVDINNCNYSYADSTDFHGNNKIMWGDAIYRRIITDPMSLSSQAFILGVLFSKWNSAEFLWRNAHQNWEIGILN